MHTLALGYPKIGFYFFDNRESAGNIHILDIGFKPLTKTLDYTECFNLDDVKNLVPIYSENTNKYNRGKLLTIAGSSGYTGACILAVQAAVKTGAGIIKVVIPESLSTIYETALIEAITIPLKEQKPGRFTADSINDVISEMLWAGAVIFGPGLNFEKESAKWMVELLY